MLRRTLGFTIIVASLALLLVFARLQLADEGIADAGERQETTDFEVATQFVDLYRSREGARLFGPPRSVLLSENGIAVQYFQNVCLEWDPATRQVRLSALGERLGYRAAPLPLAQATTNPNDRYDPATGQAIFQAFLPFYDALGGADFLGHPISKVVIEEGRLVQYFTCARLDWYPEDGPDRSVRLGPLGDMALRRGSLRPAGLDLVASQAVSPDAGPYRLSASVEHAVTGKGGNQTVNIRLTDAAGRGVAEAPVQVLVHERRGDRPFYAPATDSQGYTRFTFPIGNPPSGYTIVIDVTARWEGREVMAHTSYVPWY